MKRTVGMRWLGVACAGVLGLAMSGCVTTAAKTETGKPEVAVAAHLPTIRIKAGWESDFTDSKGVVWSADRGFVGGTAEPRQDTLDITSTDRPEMFKSERYFEGDGSYSFDVPNGKYIVNLFFSEDYEDDQTADSRIFTFAIKDGEPEGGKVIKEVKDFSPWTKAGGWGKGYIERTEVPVTSGKISIVFISQQVQNPQINAIEIVPE